MESVNVRVYILLVLFLQDCGLFYQLCITQCRCYLRLYYYPYSGWWYLLYLVFSSSWVISNAGLSDYSLSSKHQKKSSIATENWKTESRSLSQMLYTIKYFIWIEFRYCNKIDIILHFYLVPAASVKNNFPGSKFRR